MRRQASNALPIRVARLRMDTRTSRLTTKSTLDDVLAVAGLTKQDWDYLKVRPLLTSPSLSLLTTQVLIDREHKDLINRQREYSGYTGPVDLWKHVYPNTREEFCKKINAEFGKGQIGTPKAIPDTVVIWKMIKKRKLTRGIYCPIAC